MYMGKCYTYRRQHYAKGLEAEFNFEWTPSGGHEKLEVRSVCQYGHGRYENKDQFE